ncbi:hypothetical protein LTR85_002561 [Meristemomyces frigidus]|nr:hypothetical protein LTR85_002561 [Meristemomyces frigidus]
MAPTLLTLPGELRNLIYEFAAIARHKSELPRPVAPASLQTTYPAARRARETLRRESNATVDPGQWTRKFCVKVFMCRDGILLPMISAHRGEKTVWTVHPLAHLSCQTRREFLAHLYKTRMSKANFRFTVTDFDFTELFKVTQQHPSTKARMLLVLLKTAKNASPLLDNLQQWSAAYRAHAAEDPLLARAYKLIYGSRFRVRFEQSNTMPETPLILYGNILARLQALPKDADDGGSLALDLLYHYDYQLALAQVAAWEAEGEGPHGERLAMAQRQPEAKDAHPTRLLARKRLASPINDGFGINERQWKRREMERLGRWAVDEGYDARGSKDESYGQMLDGLAGLQL